MPKSFPDDMVHLLSCVCAERSVLSKTGDTLACRSCGMRFPIVDGAPVILNPASSVFDTDTVIREYRAGRYGRLERLGLAMQRFVPRVGSNISVSRVVALMRDMLSSVTDPKILVVGGGDVGAGLDSFLDDPRYTVVESDVYFGPRSNLIADGHDLPFQSECFDAVICQAVLEHVARPHDCIDEMHRVLKSGGVLFVDVPFLFPVHMGAHDFTRFTLSGLRAACRRFAECEAGVSGGPGQALAWMIYYYFRALSSSRIWSGIVALVVPWFIFWLQYSDKLLAKKAQASDVASGLYFVGTKSNRTRTDREVLRDYWRFKSARDASVPAGRSAEVEACTSPADFTGNLPSGF